MYKVLAKFTDLQDHKYAYKAGDMFPREGLKVSADRIKELSTSANKRGIPLIEKVQEVKELKKAETQEEIQADEAAISENSEAATEESEKPAKRKSRKNKE